MQLDSLIHCSCDVESSCAKFIFKLDQLSESKKTSKSVSNKAVKKTTVPQSKLHETRQLEKMV